MSALEQRIAARADRIHAAAEAMHLALLVGQQMRIAQCSYFKTRDRAALSESKRLEREFDKLTREAFAKVDGP